MTANDSTLISRYIGLQDGLSSLDEQWDELQTLFEQLELYSVETAEYEDVLTFATSILYFGLVREVGSLQD